MLENFKMSLNQLFGQPSTGWLQKTEKKEGDKWVNLDWQKRRAKRLGGREGRNVIITHKNEWASKAAADNYSFKTV